MSNNIETKNTFMGLFGSEARRLLLLNFFLNPEKEFYARELEKKLGINVGNLARELKKIEASGLIISRNVGHILLYKANKEFVIFKEFKDMVIKVAGVEELLKPIFAKIPAVKVAFIYGSYARGDFDYSSDIDLMFIGKIDLDTYTDVGADLYDLEKKIGREINSDPLTIGEFRKKIKEKNTYLLDVLDHAKIFIKGGEDELRLLSD